jgi:hypothetical protein
MLTYEPCGVRHVRLYSIVQEHRTSSANRRNKFLFFSDLFAQVDVKGNGTSPSAAGGTLPDLKSTRHTPVPSTPCVSFFSSSYRSNVTWQFVVLFPIRFTGFSPPFYLPSFFTIVKSVARRYLSGGRHFLPFVPDGSFPSFLLLEK